MTCLISFLCLHLLSNKGVSSDGLWLGVCVCVHSVCFQPDIYGGERERERKKGESYFINLNFFSVARFIIWRVHWLWLPFITMNINKN